MGDRPRGLFFEELEVGAVYRTKGRTVTEADIVNFAGLSGDFNELHLNAEYAARTQFGQRIAHGLLGLAVSSGLTQQLDLYNDTLLAFLGLTWSFKGPIFIGDTVHVVQTVKDKRPTKKPGRGIVTIGVQVLNQRGEVVQEGERTIMIRMKEGGG
jgi:acyl dehydratase